MPRVWDDPVARRRRGDHTIIIGIHPEPPLHRSPQKSEYLEKEIGEAPPRRPERVAPLTDAAIAAAPNRIERKWNRRRHRWRPQRVALSTSCTQING